MAIGTNEKLGLPYQGSKRRIAARIVGTLPAAPVLVDVFAGGCAVTHAALLSGRFNTVIANDLSDAPQLFYCCARYGASETPRWASRDEFFALKDRDPLIRYCYSFKNGGSSYLYGREIEPLKRAAHYAVVGGDCSLLPAAIRESVCEALNGVAGVHERYLCYTRAIRASNRRFDLEHLEQLEHLEHLERLQRLQRLKRLEHLERLVTSRRDYRDVYIPDGAVVYCDPPYANTEGYGVAFDPRAFYAWCRAVGKRHPLFVSEYWMPSDFRCVAEFTVRALAGAKTNAQTRVEKIFTPR